MKAQIAIDYKNCTGCGICVKKCPMEIYGLADKKVVIKKEEECMLCWFCETECPQNVIKVNVI